MARSKQSGKGFTKQKALTKGQIVEQHGNQIKNTQTQIQTLVQMLIQQSQHVQQLQQEVSTLANLVRFTSKTTPAEYNDFAIIDTFGKVYNEDGTLGDPFDGGTLFGFAAELLEDNIFIPGFVQSIVGKSAGESFNVDLTFPEEYAPNKDLAGKKVQFNIVVLKVLSPPNNNTTVLDQSNAWKKEQAARAEAAKAAETSTTEETKTAEA